MKNFSKNKNFCPLPFMALDILDNSYGPCCHNKNINFKKYKTIDGYLQSEELKELRETVSIDSRHYSCKKCWDLEDKGLPSMRQSVLQDRSNTDLDVISQVKLHTGMTCNFACMMCFPTVSSTWNNLWKDKNYPEPYNKTLGHEKYDYQAENYIKNNIKNIKYIETLGGEPFFNKSFLKLLDWIIDKNYAEEITLYIITNGSLVTEQFKQKLNFFKKVVLSISLEGIGKVNDYIRWGSNWDIIQKNIELNRKNFDIAILPTIMSLNLHRIHELESFCESNQLYMMQLNPVKGWDSLNPINLPLYLQDTLQSKYKKYVDDKQTKGNLKEFIINWDKKRNISILDYMPEFKELMYGEI